MYARNHFTFTLPPLFIVSKVLFIKHTLPKCCCNDRNKHRHAKPNKILNIKGQTPPEVVVDTPPSRLQFGYSAFSLVESSFL